MALIEKLQRGERVDMIFFLFDYELWIIYTTFCVLKLRPLLIILHTIAIKYAYLYVEMIALIAFYVLLLFKVSAHS